VRYQKTDVTSRPAWDALIGVAIAHGPSHGVDILVNNAGTSYKNKPTRDVTEAEFDLVMRVNVKSVFHSIGSLFALQPPSDPSNVARAVSIVNIASTGSHRPRPGLVWYNASKGAVLNATKGLAGEYGPYQVRVNAILPLLGATALFSTFTGVELGVDPEETKRKFIGNVPMGRLCTEGDVAGCALWLAGGESRFVTGQGIEVDGGKCIG
jgi:NAD(P)-dependent dehydrogenase (short-subunit alcohol dehydrogenase family)